MINSKLEEGKVQDLSGDCAVHGRVLGVSMRPGKYNSSKSTCLEMYNLLLRGSRLR